MHSVPIQPKFLSIIDGGANAFGAFGSLTTFNDGGQVHSLPIQPLKDGGKAFGSHTELFGSHTANLDRRTEQRATSKDGDPNALQNALENTLMPRLL